MPTYSKTSGTAGTMQMRDDGSVIEFWFKAGYTDNWMNGMRFNWTANGSTTEKSINYPTGAPWVKIGQATVTTSQTVTFRLLSATGTTGMGGPTTFSHAFDRGSVPSAPTKPALSAVTATSVVATFVDGPNGGLSIDSRQIGYSTSSTGTKTLVSASTRTTITGLKSGTTYYFWARTHNAKGWSAWSAYSSTKTLNAPSAPSAPLLSSVTSTSVDVAFSAPSSNGGSAITAYQIGYGISPAVPMTLVSAKSPQVISGLEPGTIYYFFVRAQNSAGWGPWSTPTSVRTVAGAYILVGSTWKLAVPYVNVNGVWKIAEPWVRSLGTWKRTI